MRNFSLFLLLFGFAFAAQAQQINEIRTDQPGGDTDEYLEIIGTPGASLDGISLVVIGDGSGGQGVIDGGGGVVDLSGNTIPADGTFLVYDGEAGTLGATPDLVTSLGFENGQSTTFILATNVTAAEGDDLDAEDDGVLEVLPWDSVLDAVSIVDDSPDDIAYANQFGGDELGPVGTFPPGHIYRFSDTGNWAIGEFDPTAPGATDTPGADNPAEGGGTEPNIRTSGAVQFGAVQIGMSVQRTLTVENIGDADLVVSGASITLNDEGAFSGGSGGFTVAPGSSEDITLTFAPTDGARGYTGEFTITSNDPDEGTVNVILGGTGTEAPQPEINVAPTSIDFGDVEAGTTTQRSVTISNSGTGSLTLDIDVFGTRFSLVGTAPTSVAPGGSETIMVEFAPIAAGEATGTIRIISNDQDEGTINVSLTGNGTVTPDPEPEIDVAPTSVDFGTVTIGSSAQETVTISNIGDAPLAISSIFLSDDVGGTDFSIVSGGEAGSIPADGTREVVIAFAPTVTFSQNSTLIINSDDADEGMVSIPLSGTGQDAPPTDCDYTFAAININGLTLPSEGGQVRYKFEIDNSANASAASVDIWATVEADGEVIFVRNPRPFVVDAGTVIRKGYNQRIPGFVPNGVYGYTIFAGDFNEDDPMDSEVCGTAAFSVTKGDPGKADTAAVEASEWSDVEIVSLEVVTEQSLETADAPVRVGPNPVRSRATFAFGLAEASEVNLAVYDARGRQVATVLSGSLQAGTHTATLDRALPAGVYVWRLTAGERIETGRLTVVR